MPTPTSLDVWMRCEPCPRPILARRTLPDQDGAVYRHFRCDGNCMQASVHTCPPSPSPGPLPGHHQANASPRGHRVAIVPIALRSRDRAIERIVRAFVIALAVLAALATTFAVRHAAADTRSTTANYDADDDADDENEDDDDAVDTVSPPTREAAWLTSVEAPPVKDVLAAAYRTAGLDGDVGPGFARRARLAGLVPLVSVRTGRDSSWRDSDPDVARGMVIDVRATWRLDRLVFDGRELQALSLEAARRRERRRLASQVIELYFRWKRASEAPGRAEEAAAALDDLTTGWFSEEVGVRAKMSESRTLR